MGCGASADAPEGTAGATAAIASVPSAGPALGARAASSPSSVAAPSLVVEPTAARADAVLTLPTIPLSAPNSRCGSRRGSGYSAFRAGAASNAVVSSPKAVGGTDVITFAVMGGSGTKEPSSPVCAVLALPATASGPRQTSGGGGAISLVGVGASARSASPMMSPMKEDVRAVGSGNASGNVSGASSDAGLPVMPQRHAVNTLLGHTLTASVLSCHGVYSAEGGRSAAFELGAANAMVPGGSHSGASQGADPTTASNGGISLGFAACESSITSLKSAMGSQLPITVRHAQRGAAQSQPSVVAAVGVASDAPAALAPRALSSASPPVALRRREPAEASVFSDVLVSPSGESASPAASGASTAAGSTSTVRHAPRNQLSIVSLGSSGTGMVFADAVALPCENNINNSSTNAASDPSVACRRSPFPPHPAALAASRNISAGSTGSLGRSLSHSPQAPQSLRPSPRARAHGVEGGVGATTAFLGASGGFLSRLSSGSGCSSATLASDRGSALSTSGLGTSGNSINTAGGNASVTQPNPPLVELHSASDACGVAGNSGMAASTRHGSGSGIAGTQMNCSGSATKAAAPLGHSGSGSACAGGFAAGGSKTSTPSRPLSAHAAASVEDHPGSAEPAAALSQSPSSPLALLVGPRRDCDGRPGATGGSGSGNHHDSSSSKPSSLSGVEDAATMFSAHLWVPQLSETSTHGLRRQHELNRSTDSPELMAPMRPMRRGF